jgi:uncharacterized protein (TIRG00374 family)
MTQEQADLATNESTVAKRRPWWILARRIAGPAIRLLIVAAVIEFALLPQIAGARKSINLLSDISPAWLSLGLGCQILSLLAYAKLSQVSLDAGAGVGYFQLLRVDLSTLAVSHVVPAGSAVGIGLGYRLLVRSGVSSDHAVSGKALQTVGSAVVLNVLLGGALLAALLTHGNNPLYAPIAAVGLALILATGMAGVLIARGETRIARVVVRMLDRLPRVDAESGARLVATLAGTIRRLGADRRFLARLVGWALLNWLLEAGALWACVRAFGHSLGPVGLLVAYGLANVAAAIPITPGGLGIVEGILVPTLVAFDTERGVAVLGVLAFRLMSFWLPIPIGFAAYARLEWKLRHQDLDTENGGSGGGTPQDHPDLPEAAEPKAAAPNLTKREAAVGSSEPREDGG